MSVPPTAVQQLSTAPPGRRHPCRADAVAAARSLVDNVERVVLGQRAAVEAAVTAAVAGGHLLVEDVPGTGKTLLARALAVSLGGTFRRVQATADLLPSDITGSSVLDQRSGGFTFVPGPVFAHVVLVDELNRTSPRTQSALMEAMDEAAVTVDGVRHPLPAPFLLVATQNPVEQHGTFPLPEGQLDRFLLAIGMGYVDPVSERALVREQLVRPPVEDLEPVLDPAGLLAVRAEARATYVDDAVLDYAVALVGRTRGHPALALGASSRATVALVRAGQARALLAGRDFVTPDDVKALAAAVLAHRVVARQASWGAAAGIPARDVVAGVVAETPAPVVR